MFVYVAATSSFVRVGDDQTQDSGEIEGKDEGRAAHSPSPTRCCSAVQARPTSAEPLDPDPLFRWRPPPESVYAAATLETAKTLLEVVEDKRKRRQRKAGHATDTSCGKEHAAWEGADSAENFVVPNVDDERRGRHYFFKRCHADVSRLSARRRDEADAAVAAGATTASAGARQASPIRQTPSAIPHERESHDTAAGAKRRVAPHQEAARSALHAYWISAVKCLQIADPFTQRAQDEGEARDDQTQYATVGDVAEVEVPIEAQAHDSGQRLLMMPNDNPTMSIALRVVQ